MTLPGASDDELVGQRIALPRFLRGLGHQRGHAELLEILLRDALQRARQVVVDADEVTLQRAVVQRRVEHAFLCLCPCADHYRGALVSKRLQRLQTLMATDDVTGGLVHDDRLDQAESPHGVRETLERPIADLARVVRVRFERRQIALLVPNCGRWLSLDWSCLAVSLHLLRPLTAVSAACWRNLSAISDTEQSRRHPVACTRRSARRTSSGSSSSRSATSSLVCSSSACSTRRPPHAQSASTRIASRSSTISASLAPSDTSGILDSIGLTSGFGFARGIRQETITRPNVAACGAVPTNLLRRLASSPMLLVHEETNEATEAEQRDLGDVPSRAGARRQPRQALGEECPLSAAAYLRDRARHALYRIVGLDRDVDRGDLSVVNVSRKGHGAGVELGLAKIGRA